MNSFFRRGLRIVGWTVAVLIASAAVGWFGVPSFRMYRFEAALAAKDYDAAAAMVGGPHGSARSEEFGGATFEALPPTWKEVLTGQRFIAVRTSFVVDGKVHQRSQNYWATPLFLGRYGC